MIGCLQTRVRKQPVFALYFEFENELNFYNLKAGARHETLTINESNKNQRTISNQITALEWIASTATGVGLDIFYWRRIHAKFYCC